MICLEKFYQETGLSRALFADISGTSADSLKKYEWSRTDRMRKSTIDKIETAASKCLEHSLRSTGLYFGRGHKLTWDSRPEGYYLEGWRYYEGIHFIRKEMEL